MSLRRNVGPVRGPRCALLHPGDQQLLFGRGQALVVVGGRHDFVRVVGQNSPHQGAGFRVAGDDCEVPVQVGQRALLRVQPEAVGTSSLALPRVGTVAGVTFVGENRADIAVEVHTVVGRGSERQQGGCQQQQDTHGQVRDLRRRGGRSGGFLIISSTRMPQEPGIEDATFRRCSMKQARHQIMSGLGLRMCCRRSGVYFPSSCEWVWNSFPV